MGCSVVALLLFVFLARGEGFRYRGRRGGIPRAARLPVVLGHERQNPVRRSQRQRTAALDPAHQTRVAQRHPAEPRRAQARAFEERPHPRSELLLQRHHAPNAEDLRARASTCSKRPTVPGRSGSFRTAPKPLDRAANGLGNAPIGAPGSLPSRVRRKVDPDGGGRGKSPAWKLFTPEVHDSKCRS